MWKVCISLRKKAFYLINSDLSLMYVTHHQLEIWNVSFKEILCHGKLFWYMIKKEYTLMLFAWNLFESKYYGFDLVLWFPKSKTLTIPISNWKNDSKLLERKQMHDFQCCQFFKQKTTMWKVWIFLRTKIIWFDQFKPFIDAMLKRYPT